MSDEEEDSPQEIDSPDECDPTNPFSKGLKEALAKEREVLEALKDPSKVPAIVCDNRDKIRLAWLSNMNQWKLAEKDAEIQQKRAENDTIRKQIDVAQVKLAESEVRVQQRRKSPRETSP